jgi:putative ABC transport system substrate-binding protein
MASVEVFGQELTRLRQIEGREVTIDERFGQGDLELVARQARELAALQPAVLVAQGSAPLTALRMVAGPIPIAFSNVGDPVAGGFVASMSHPGGNVTGVYGISPVPASTLYMQLMKDLLPRVTRVAYPWWDNGTPAQTSNLRQHQTAAQQLGITLTSYPLHTADELEAAITAIQGNGEEAIRISGDGLLSQVEARVENFSAESRIPVIWGAPQARRWTLAAYGSDTDEPYRRLAMLVDLILAGANPGELPVQQVLSNTLFVVNKAAAEALGVVIPPAVLARATEIIS